MNSLLSSITHLRTTLPGVGLVLVAVGHWWYTGHFSSDDLMAIIGAGGLVASEGKA
jgi:hypothetical protein